MFCLRDFYVNAFPRVSPLSNSPSTHSFLDPSYARPNPIEPKRPDLALFKYSCHIETFHRLLPSLTSTSESSGYPNSIGATFSVSRRHIIPNLRSHTPLTLNRLPWNSFTQEQQAHPVEPRPVLTLIRMISAPFSLVGCHVPHGVLGRTALLRNTHPPLTSGARLMCARCYSPTVLVLSSLSAVDDVFGAHVI